MDDTILSSLQLSIMNLFNDSTQYKSSQIHKMLNIDSSLVTTIRAINSLVSKGFLSKEGSARATKYRLTNLGLILLPINSKEYLSIEQDKRTKEVSFNFELFTNFADNFFTKAELKSMDDATQKYIETRNKNTELINKKQLERFIIEFSWKSSKIEGNTYDLLDTEALILHGINSKKNTKEETQMILNHKTAFDYIYKNKTYFKTANKIEIQNVHSLMSKDLGVSSGFRDNQVGITGTNYTPPQNIHQIQDAISLLIKCINTRKTIYEKAIISIIGLSYIQAFEDANKRTARLYGNAILLSNNHAPLSYRSVDEKYYKEACLIFYEKNSLFEFKKIFIEQYLFSTNNYTFH